MQRSTATSLLAGLVVAGAGVFAFAGGPDQIQTDQLFTGTPGAVSRTAAAAEGSSGAVARADHVHSSDGFTAPGACPAGTYQVADNANGGPSCAQVQVEQLGDAGVAFDDRFVNVAGDSMTGRLNLGSASSEALRLQAGATADHVYGSFFADSQAQSTRSGWFGYGSSATTTLTIQNEMAAGNLDLLALGNVRINGNTAWHAGNDGAASLLDADLLDGLSSGAFGRTGSCTLPSVVTGINAGAPSCAVPNGVGNVSSATDANVSYRPVGNRLYSFQNSTGSLNFPAEFGHTLQLDRGADGTTSANGAWRLFSSTADDSNLFVSKYAWNTGTASGAWRPWGKLWNDQNDGDGSQLDADQVDGQPHTDDSVLVANGTSYQAKTIPDCDLATQTLGYDTATNAWTCGTDSDTVYTLPAATAAALGGVKGPAGALACTGTQKVSGLAADGALVCSADSDTGATDVWVNTTGDAMTGWLGFGSAATSGGIRGTGASSDPFTYDGDTLEHYGVRWYSDSQAGYLGSTLALSGYYGVRLFTQGTPKLSINQAGAAAFTSSTITAGGNTVWHAGNDGNTTGLDADKLDTFDRCTQTAPWNCILFAGVDGVIEIGKYFDFHESNPDANDYDGRLSVNAGILSYSSAEQGSGTVLTSSLDASWPARFHVGTFSTTVTPTKIHIRTKIPATHGWGMPFVRFEGFGYGAAMPIDALLTFYPYDPGTGLTFTNHGIVQSGGWQFTTQLAYEGGFVSIVLTPISSSYFSRFHVRAGCIGQTCTEAAFDGWTFEETDFDVGATSIVSAPNVSPYLDRRTGGTVQGAVTISAGTASPGLRIASPTAAPWGLILSRDDLGSGSDVKIHNAGNILYSANTIQAATSASGADSIAFQILSSSYAIGMGPTATEGTMLYQAGTGDANTHGHRFKVNGTDRFFVGGDGVLRAGGRTSTNTVWHAGNDGAGSAADADKLDGRELANGTGTTIDTGTAGQYQVDLAAATASTLGGVKGTGTGLTCASGYVATGFALDGTLQCAADVDTDTDTLGSLGTPTDDYALIGNGSAWVKTQVPNCATTGSHLAYNATTNALECLTNTASASGPVTTVASRASDIGYNSTTTTTILTVAQNEIPASANVAFVCSLIVEISASTGHLITFASNQSGGYVTGEFRYNVGVTTITSAAGGTAGTQLTFSSAQTGNTGVITARGSYVNAASTGSFVVVGRTQAPGSPTTGTLKTGSFCNITYGF